MRVPQLFAEARDVVERRRVIGLLAANAIKYKRLGLGPYAWMLLWYQPDCFAESESFSDEMNAAVAYTAGWVWGPQRRSEADA